MCRLWVSDGRGESGIAQKISLNYEYFYFNCMAHSVSCGWNGIWFCWGLLSHSDNVPYNIVKTEASEWEYNRLSCEITFRSSWSVAEQSGSICDKFRIDCKLYSIFMHGITLLIACFLSCLVNYLQSTFPRFCLLRFIHYRHKDESFVSAAFEYENFVFFFSL